MLYGYHWKLNVVLIAVILLACSRFRREWRRVGLREAATFKAPQRTAPSEVFLPLSATAPVKPEDYADIAQKMLFDKSRNPIPVAEVLLPPTPAPQPPLPLFHGVMDLGGGVTAFLSEKRDSPQRALHIGDTIGNFTLVGISREEVILEWGGQTIHEGMDDEFTSVLSEAGPGARSPEVIQPEAESNSKAAKTCMVADGIAEGTVREGYKKALHLSHLGTSCTWEPLGL